MPVHAALPQTFADYLQLLGAVPADRVHTHPAPGTASLDDWFAARQQGVVCELIDEHWWIKQRGSTNHFWQRVWFATLALLQVRGD